MYRWPISITRCLALASILVFLPAVSCFATVSAGFYAIDGGTGNLWRIDPVTLTPSNIGNAGLSVGAWSGLAVHEGELFSTEVDGNHIASVDPDTGEAISTYQQSFNNWQAVVSVNGLLYAWEYGGSDNGAQMHVIDPVTGLETHGGFMSVTAPRGADVDESTGLIYAIGSDDRLYTLTLNTLGNGGTATPIGPTGIDFTAARVGLAYNPLDQHLYAIGDDAVDGDNLYRLDKATGAATFVIKTGIDIGTSLEFIVPEPSSFLLSTFGASLLIRRRHCIQE